MKRPFGGDVYVIPSPRFGEHGKFAILHPLPDGRHPPLCDGIENQEIAEYMAAVLNASPEIPDPPKPPRETGFYRCLQRIKGRKTKPGKPLQPDREVWGIWYWSAAGEYWRDPENEGDDPDRYSDKDFIVIEDRISESP